MDKIDFIIPVRDREDERVQNCINSIVGDFVGKIFVIDYGSKTPVEVYGVEIIRVSKEKYLTWNKSHALNIGIKRSKNKFVGTVDCDIILSKEFLDEVSKYLSEENFIFTSGVRRIDKFISMEKLLESSKCWTEETSNYQQAVGGVQIFSREWACVWRGYAESLVYWGGIDNWMLLLAEKTGLKLEDMGLKRSPDGTFNFIFHQEHIYKKEDNLDTEEEKKIACKVRQWRTEEINFLVKGLIIKNKENWGEFIA